MFEKDQLMMIDGFVVQIYKKLDQFIGYYATTIIMERHGDDYYKAPDSCDECGTTHKRLKIVSEEFLKYISIMDKVLIEVDTLDEPVPHCIWVSQ